MKQLKPKYPLFFKNIPEKLLPTEDYREGSEYINFWQNQRSLCKKGIPSPNIEDLVFPGTLYYGLNHTKLSYEVIDENGESVFKIDRPAFRDTDWYIHTNFNRTVKNRLGFIMASSRQIGKTSTLVTLVTHEINFNENAEVLYISSNSADEDTFIKYLDVQLKNNTRELQIPSIDKDFRKNTIRFGQTYKSNDTEKVATLYKYNTADGTNVQIASGKALEHGSKVYYSDRIGVIEHVKVGDKIYGKNGELTEVLGVYPQGEVNLYEIVFSDGRTVTCSEDHLWTLKRIDNKKKVITIDTKTILETYKRKYFNKKLGKEVDTNRYLIPTISCVDYPHKEVTIEPYYLGLYLGDGITNCCQSITTVDDEVIEYLREYSDRLRGRLSKDVNDIVYKIRNVKDGGKNPLFDYFKEYGIIKNKRIPLDYLYNSEEVRYELLKGIMDSDGYISKKGHIQLDISDELLKNDIIQLIRSLGINCTITSRIPTYIYKGEKRKGKLSYRIYIGILDKAVFKLKRKLIRQTRNTPKQSNQNGASIVDVKYKGKGLATCIKVDNEDSLFLTNDFIPTHNTVTMYVYDENAKNKWLKVHEAILPAITSLATKGLKAKVFHCMTGGEAKTFGDAKKAYFNPKTYMFDAFDEDNTGFFLDATYKSAYKKEITFGEFLLEKYGKTFGIDEIDALPILVRDYDYAVKEVEADLEEARNAGMESYNMRRMFNPMKKTDIFLSGEDNIFAHLASELEALKDYLINNRVSQFRTVKFIKDPLSPDKVVATDWHKPFPLEYPLPKDLDVDTPVVIVEEPYKVSRGKLYVMGADLINVDKTQESASLASFYVMQRTTADYNDPHNDRIVAFYNGRRSMKDFQDKLLDTLKYYGAENNTITLLHEAANDALTQSFSEKNKAFYLEDTYTLSKDINPNTIVNNNKGLRPTQKIQNYYLSRILEYLEEELPDGRLGLWRIEDPYLVSQLLSFDGTLNPFDAIVAFGHTLVHLNKEKRYFIPSKDVIEKKEKPRKYGRTPFSSKYKRSAI